MTTTQLSRGTEQAEVRPTRPGGTPAPRDKAAPFGSRRGPATALLGAMVLSVFKPWGRRRTTGRR